jgi:hypothetical protein
MDLISFPGSAAGSQLLAAPPQGGLKGCLASYSWPTLAEFLLRYPSGNLPLPAGAAVVIVEPLSPLGALNTGTGYFLSWGGGGGSPVIVPLTLGDAYPCGTAAADLAQLAISSGVGGATAASGSMCLTVWDLPSGLLQVDRAKSQLQLIQQQPGTLITSGSTGAIASGTTLMIPLTPNIAARFKSVYAQARVDVLVGALTAFTINVRRYDQAGLLLGLGNEFIGANPPTMVVGTVAINGYQRSGATFQLGAGQTRTDMWGLPAPDQLDVQVLLTVATSASISWELWGTPQ